VYLQPDAAVVHASPAFGSAEGQPGGCELLSTTDPVQPSGSVPITAIIAAAQVFHVVFIAILLS